MRGQLGRQASACGFALTVLAQAPPGSSGVAHQSTSRSEFGVEMQTEQFTLERGHVRVESSRALADWRQGCPSAQAARSVGPNPAARNRPLAQCCGVRQGAVSETRMLPKARYVSRYRRNRFATLRPPTCEIHTGPRSASTPQPVSTLVSCTKATMPPLQRVVHA